MYAAMVHYFVNGAGIPYGAGAVSPALGGWLVVAAFLLAAVILSTCFDRGARRTWSGRGIRWAATTRFEQGLQEFRVRCAGAVLKNAGRFDRRQSMESCT